MRRSNKALHKCSRPHYACVSVCVQARASVFNRKLNCYIVWWKSNSDTPNMLKLPFPHTQNAITATTLTVLFLSLIRDMPRTKKYAFIVTAQFLAHSTEADSTGCLHNIHPPFIFTEKTPTLLDATKYTDKTFTLSHSLAVRSSHMTIFVNEKPTQD